MADSETSQNGSELEFQRRLLTALEKPKQSTLVAVINSAFFLWVLSAVFLTVGGAYFAGHQQCLKEANDIVERFPALSAEFFDARRALWSAIEVTGNPRDTAKWLADYKPKDPDLKDKNLREITRQVSAMRSQIDGSAWEAFTRIDRDEWPKETGSVLGQWGRGIQARVDQSTFNKMRQDVRQFIAIDARGRFAESRSEYVRTCGPITVLRRVVLVENPAIVRLDPPSGIDPNSADLRAFVTIDSSPAGP